MISALEEILKEAKNAGASDVHLVVGNPPIMRLGRRIETMKFPALTASDTLDAMLKVLNETQRELFESRGEYEVSFSVADGSNVRVSVYKQSGLAVLALRIFMDKIPLPAQIGIEERVTALCSQAQGLILVTGQSGCGKTTTIASMVQQINESQDRLIVTLEKPVEYVYKNSRSLIVQRQIGTDTDSMAQAVRAVLRENADVVVLSEVSDYETVDGILTLVETGHFVLAEVQAADISGAIDRLTALSPATERAILKARLTKIPLAVIAQKTYFDSDRKTEFKFLQNQLWQGAD